MHRDTGCDSRCSRNCCDPKSLLPDKCNKRQTDLPEHRRNNPASLGAPLRKSAKNLFCAPADARPVHAIRAVITFSYGFRFRLWSVIMAGLQHTAVSAVAVTVPTVLWIAVLTIICHDVHLPEKGKKYARPYSRKRH